ncbi:NAD(P)-dependent alcohol dehydrogenase [Aquimarina sp. 2201CG5-10]|uniref:NAD(P)-dependent alcohol dehydrogenase n=1 Tax=Aquimarina callyspongiae TaxID=3098150 RepID=UPI002AB3DC11|nr:NAD(P)-dependent alcohol dehydrogenase [Aquimarina sp. 2201CG5-10]MDY8136827.1 NAD(P)-dependent alcohol dehydrogenase [Aquimarina sp. 2201CG5-10]
MKAAVYQKYGTTEVLRIQQVEKPVPKDNEVLVKVNAASVNSWDWDLLRGKPFVVRLAGGGLFSPKKHILGCDIAGKIEAIGKNVKQFKIGDEVFGDISQCGWGGFAQYVCTKENSLIHKPAEITFETAAAIPQAGVMAYQGIYDYGRVKSGQKILINGAGGGVGTFAIQMAKSCGAHVTGVDSKHKFDIMKSIGADHTINYKQEDCTKTGQQYDLILDVVGHHSIYDFKRALLPGGTYRMIGGHTNLIFQSLLVGPLISIITNKTMGILAHEPNKNLDTILTLIKTGQITPIVDQLFPLEKTAEALEYLGNGGVKGKIVITM